MYVFSSIKMCTILKFQHCWDLGLQAVEEAMLIMPKEIIHHLFKHKLMFKSKMGKNVEGDILKFSVSPNA